MKKPPFIFDIMKQHLHSAEFLNNNKIGSKAFLRNRLLPFPVVFSFIFNLLKKSIPKELMDFCKNCSIKTSTRSAVTKARAKLSSNAFIEMNHVLLNEFYNDNPFKKFHGLTVTAVDGSTVLLPADSPETFRKYGGATNQTDTTTPMARISTLYDVMNGITWDAIIAPYISSERTMAIQHVEAIKSLKIDLTKLLMVFDRGYPSLALLVYLLKNGINFLMRSNRQFLKEVNEAVEAGKKDTVVQISLKRATPAVKEEFKELFPDLNFNETISIRIVVVRLKTGEDEVLITSLLDKEKYPYKIFKELYFKRWGTEENYKFFKVHLEIENFSGRTPLAIEQDFHATVLTANSRALLALDAIEEIENNENKLCEGEKKYTYAINKNISMHAMKNEFVAALLDPNSDMEEFCKDTKEIMKKNLVPIRPEKSSERRKKHPHRKYHMNQR